jgi:hypothetical protein
MTAPTSHLYLYLPIEKRAKKMEEMAAKRNAGEDDCASVSGLSKLRRRRKKKSENDEPSGVAQPDDVTGEEAFKDEAAADVAKEETEEEKLRRKRAGNVGNYFLLFRFHIDMDFNS